jgi:hypothetical protein
VAAANYIAEMEGSILANANENLQVRFASEVAGSGVTVKRGTNGLLFTL